MWIEIGLYNRETACIARFIYLSAESGSSVNNTILTVWSINDNHTRSTLKTNFHLISIGVGFRMLKIPISIGAGQKYQEKIEQRG